MTLPGSALAALALASLLTGCAGTARGDQGADPDLAAADLYGSPDCQPVTPIEGTGAQLAPDGIEARANLGWGTPPWQVGQEVKTVFRVTGEGALTVEALGPNGATAEPTWGPTFHTRSNWNWPGDEWGVGFALPTLGCWEIRLSRDEGSASLWLEVVDP